MNLLDIDLIEQAAALLDTDAFEIRMSHNVDHRNPDWKGEPEAKAAHDMARSTAGRLFALAKIERSKLGASHG